MYGHIVPPLLLFVPDKTKRNSIYDPLFYDGTFIHYNYKQDKGKNLKFVVSQLFLSSDVISKRHVCLPSYTISHPYIVKQRISLYRNCIVSRLSIVKEYFMEAKGKKPIKTN